MYEIAGSFQLHYQEHLNIGAEKKGFKYLLQRNRLGQTSRKTVGCVLLQLPKSVWELAESLERHSFIVRNLRANTRKEDRAGTGS